MPQRPLDLAIAVHQAGRPHPHRRQIGHVRRAQLGGVGDGTRSVQGRRPGVAGHEVEDHHLHCRAGKSTNI